MKQDRYQFFEFENLDPRKPRWMQRSFLDRVTRQVYLPVVDTQTQIIAMLDDELTHVNNRPYCRLRLYAQQLPEMRAELLALEKRLRAAA